MRFLCFAHALAVFCLEFYREPHQRESKSILESSTGGFIVATVTHSQSAYEWAAQFIYSRKGLKVRRKAIGSGPETVKWIYYIVSPFGDCESLLCRVPKIIGK
jgi:hypothetical protein